jgi:dolichol-phosphate mannosyltransferase
MKYSYILPVYNEQENISELYGRLTKVAKSLSTSYELIFVNDGSVDSTLPMLMDLNKKDDKIKIIDFSRNFGHQMAVTAGLNFSTGKFVAVLDADLQDPPEILPDFFGKLEEGFDVVYAIRTDRQESWLLKICYKLFYRVLKKIAKIDMPLDSGDFCVMSKRVVDLMGQMPEKNRFVRGIRSWVGFKQTGLEYKRQARFAGKSKYHFTNLVKLALDGVLSFSYMPLRMLAAAGLVTFIISILGSLLAVYMRFFTNIFVPGFATTVILIMFMGGLNMLSLGLVGEYLGRIYDEVKQRPQYIINFTIGFSKHGRKKKKN